MNELGITHIEKLDVKEYTALLEQVAERIGPQWQAKDDGLVHLPSGMDFVLVPGGWLRMGFSPDDVLAVCRARGAAISDTSSWFGIINQSRPVRVVAIAPFLISREPLRTNNNNAIDSPFRLPSEAEFEWLLRDAGRRRWVGIPQDKMLTAQNRQKLLEKLQLPFGLDQLVSKRHLVADAWHDTLSGAPTSAEPWGEGAQVVRHVHVDWQDDDEELICLHAAYREQRSSRDGGLRWLVMGLDGILPWTPTDAPPPETEADTILIALASGKKFDLKAARSALALLATAPGPDLVPLVEAIITNLPTTKKDLLWRLEWLGELAFGPDAEVITGELNADGEQLRELLRARLAIFVPFLTHDEVEIRSAAAMILAVADPKNLEIRDTLARQFDIETDGGVATSILLSWQLLEAPRIVEVPRDTPAAEHLSLIAPIVHGMLGHIDPDGLLRAIEVGVLPGMSWFEGDLAYPAIRIMGQLSAAQRCDLALRIIEVGKHLRGMDYHHLSDLAAGLMFTSYLDVSRGDTAKTYLRYRLLRRRELDKGQHRFIEECRARYQDLPVRWHRYRIPASTRGQAILLGDDSDPFAEQVMLDSEQMTLFDALLQINAETIAFGRKDQLDRVRRLLSNRPRTDLSTLAKSAADLEELCFPLEGVGLERITAWPDGVL